MPIRFFTQHDSKEQTSHKDNLRRFLEGFPDIEFWRFFVERERYDARSELCYEIYSRKFKSLPMEKIRSLSLEQMKSEFNSLTIGDLFDIFTSEDDKKLLAILRLENRKEELLTEYIDKLVGWQAFEDGEPGYLIHATNGLSFVLSRLANNEPLTINFIKNLHKIATENVKNMYMHTPGEFRHTRVSWQLNDCGDSLTGLIESIDYLKSIKEKYGYNYHSFKIYEHNKPVQIISDLTKSSKELADTLWNAQGNFLVEHCEGGHVKENIHEILNKIGEQQISELETQLTQAKNTGGKLTAIFSYLKHAVLLHPFQDGVGRTYSMLLLQFLLMRENLLPIIIHNSNVIPGYSVQELVNEYVRAEDEMEKILQNPAYVNSDLFATPNVDTEYLRTLIPNDTFEVCLKIYQKAKENFLISKEHSESNESLLPSHTPKKLGG
ncbi:hypothetical protein [Legionella rowbothamii]|uniref:hypothetical protein n=1 Tax=Legionella rowbothamii TaxID=96229 RepID=UPI0010554240|nr:hypothetical protein [Legionella rowbothamii]